MSSPDTTRMRSFIRFIPRERARSRVWTPTPSPRAAGGSWRGTLRDVTRSSLPVVPLVAAWLIAELFFTWASFSISALAFAFTWLVLDFLWNRLLRLLGRSDH
jgi:hypothetical protein